MSILDNVLIWDVETTIYRHQNLVKQDGVVNVKNKIGTAFCLPQKLVMSGFKRLNEVSVASVGAEQKMFTERYFKESTLIVGFNIKFDLSWARRIGVDISKITIWDCQLAEFILESQCNKYPSMNQACEKYGLEAKLDVVKEDFWEKGIDSDKVPTEILREYLYGDLERTEGIFKEQIRQFKGISL